MPEPIERMDSSQADRVQDARKFRSTLLRVMIAQVVSLLGLWLLQSIYHG